MRNVNDADRWFFSKDKLQNTPSRRDGVDAAKEVFYRQQAATLIQDMGQKLLVSQLCINSAIVYMHRFYMFHSFTKFHRNLMAPCCLFLACKVEEQPRKLELLLKVGWSCMNRELPPLDVSSTHFKHLYDELVRNENILLATLGFDCSIDHPHTHVVRCCHLIRASRDLAQTSYFMATNSLHLTMMCLAYRSTLVACVCIYLVYKWSGHEIPRSSEGRDWFWYVDREVTLEQLERVSEEFLLIFNQCPSKLKKKIMSSSKAISDQEAERRHCNEGSKVRSSTSLSAAGDASSSSCSVGLATAATSSRASSAFPVAASSNSASNSQSTATAARLGPAAARAYRERKEREHQLMLHRERRGLGPERDWRPGNLDLVNTSTTNRSSSTSTRPSSTAPSASNAKLPTSSSRVSGASVGDVRQLLRDVDGRHSLLSSVASGEKQRHSASESSRHSTSRVHPAAHERPSHSGSHPRGQSLLPLPASTSSGVVNKSAANGPPVPPSTSDSVVPVQSSNPVRRDTIPVRANPIATTAPSMASASRSTTVTSALTLTSTGTVPPAPPNMPLAPIRHLPDSPPLILPDVLLDPPAASATVSSQRCSDLKSSASLMDISAAGDASLLSSSLHPRPSVITVNTFAANSSAVPSGGSIFSPPVVTRSGPELALPKLDDAVNISFHSVKMDGPAVVLNTASSTPISHPTSLMASSAPVAARSGGPPVVVGAGTGAAPLETSSLLPTDDQKQHHQKKKKKKDHKEHKAKKEKKKHKDKEHKKSKHKDRDEGLSKLRITISKDRLSSSGDVVPAPVMMSGLQETANVSRVSSPSSGLKIRIGKDKLMQTPAEEGHSKKRSRDSDLDDSGSHHHHHRHHHHSKHKNKHKRKRQDSELSDSLQF